MKQAPSVEMLKGQDRDRKGVGKNFFSSAEHTGREQKAALGKELVNRLLSPQRRGNGAEL